MAFVVSSILGTNEQTKLNETSSEHEFLLYRIYFRDMLQMLLDLNTEADGQGVRPGSGKRAGDLQPTRLGINLHVMSRKVILRH